MIRIKLKKPDSHYHHGGDREVRLEVMAYNSDCPVQLTIGNESADLSPFAAKVLGLAMQQSVKLIEAGEDILIDNEPEEGTDGTE